MVLLVELTADEIARINTLGREAKTSISGNFGETPASLGIGDVEPVHTLAEVFAGEKAIAVYDRRFLGKAIKMARDLEKTVEGQYVVEQHYLD